MHRDFTSFCQEKHYSGAFKFLLSSRSTPILTGPHHLCVLKVSQTVCWRAKINLTAASQLQNVNRCKPHPSTSTSISCHDYQPRAPEIENSKFFHVLHSPNQLDTNFYTVSNFQSLSLPLSLLTNHPKSWKFCIF